MAPLYARYIPPKATPAAAASGPKDVPKKEVAQDKAATAKDSDGRKKRKRADAVESAAEGSEQADGGGASIPKKHSALVSKFHKAAQRSEAVKAANTDHVDVEPEAQPELHDLTPLPQPERAPTPEYLPAFSSLPHWLAHPTVVSQATTRPFNHLSLSHKTLAHLESKGYTTAFAVQAALLPLLLPHPYLTRLPPNDVCVSAPTGSGKTLAYLLPIIENLRSRIDTKLRAVIVVPTRELVAQAYAVASTCAHGSAIQIALAVGNQSVAVEQESLVKRGRTYDPETYQSLMAKAKKRLHFELDSDPEDTSSALIDDVVKMPPNYVPTYSSAADLLICTPGRLVEHLASTTGFSLDDVEWLVVDEADRLLDQSFQEWVSKVTAALEVSRKGPLTDTESPALRQLLHYRERYVRKIILSATMTRDISKLSALKLRRPTMIVVKTEAESAPEAEAAAIDGAEGFELPRTLSEFAVPVGDGTDKPLYLLELLRTRILPSKVAGGKPHSGDSDSDSGSSSSEDTLSSDEDSDSSDESSSDEDDGSSDTDTSDDSSSDDSSGRSDSESDSDSSSDSSSTSRSPNRSADFTSTKPSSGGNMILIFTPSTEAAARLHHLITRIEPSYKPITTLLTKASTNPASLLPTNTRKGLSSRIIISTDRASRGLDLAQLTHVINYTIPRSLPSYVHRVGRTARAGKSGEAWTLFSENEGRWFWNEIARAKGVGRSSKVERVNLKLAQDQKEDGEMRARYEAALEAIKDIVVNKHTRPKKAKARPDGDVEMAD